jgi:hypothetical protein
VVLIIFYWVSIVHTILPSVRKGGGFGYTLDGLNLLLLNTVYIVRYGITPFLEHNKIDIDLYTRYAVSL